MITLSELRARVLRRADVNQGKWPAARLPSRRPTKADGGIAGHLSCFSTLGMGKTPPGPFYYVDPGQVTTLEIKIPREEVAAATQQKVLLLEDRDDFREVLRDHMAFRGFQVTSVPSGVEGLCEVMKGAFDLIVCDMLMPRSGGENFYWAVTRVRPGTARRFIFFTGHQNNPRIEFFFKRVNATVLRKPFRLTELDTTMSEVLRRLV